MRLILRTSSILIVAALALFSGCARQPSEGVDFVVTIPPLKLILQEITGDGDNIACILPPGASPHTFELRPSTARQLDEAKAAFYVDDSIDGWAARLATGRLQSVFAMVPESAQLPYTEPHTHEDAHEISLDRFNANAHFWSDPVVAHAIVPALVTALSTADPANATRYTANGNAFMEQLDALDREFATLSADFGEYALVAFHPSWQYFFHRYRIEVVAHVEPFPGKEPTPQMIEALKEKLSTREGRVVLSEVQLPARAARVLAETLGASVAVIDPLGGTDELNTYAKLLRHNAAQVRKALQ